MRFSKKYIFLLSVFSIVFIVSIVLWRNNVTYLNIENFQSSLTITNDETACLPKDYLSNPASLTTDFCSTREWMTTPPCRAFCNTAGNNCNLKTGKLCEK